MMSSGAAYLPGVDASLSFLSFLSSSFLIDHVRDASAHLGVTHHRRGNLRGVSGMPLHAVRSISCKNYSMYGITTAQTFFYYRTYPDDPVSTRILVRLHSHSVVLS